MVQNPRRQTFTLTTHTLVTVYEWVQLMATDTLVAQREDCTAEVTKCPPYSILNQNVLTEEIHLCRNVAT